jgi:hypothetical protein
MNSPADWASKFTDRLLNSPDTDWLLVRSGIYVDGAEHLIGRRISETCALAARAVKHGETLAVFIPPADHVDLLMIAIYLHRLRKGVLQGFSAPNSWTTPERLIERGDVWVLGRVRSLRDTMLERLAFEQQPLADSMRCAWYTQRAGRARLEGVGKPTSPAIHLIGGDALLRGAGSAALASGPAPFVVVADANESHEGRSLHEQLSRLRHLSRGAPIIIVGNLGDKAAVLQAREARVPMWLLRAGDAARMNHLEVEHCPMLRARDAGSDLASARLTAGIRVEIDVISGPALVGLVGPLLETMQRLERLAADQTELIGHARALMRAVLSLYVPLRVQMDAIALMGRVGAYASRSFQSRLNAMRECDTATGGIQSVVQRMVECAQEIFTVLQRPGCITGKQAALLQAATHAQLNRQELYVLCGSETEQCAVKLFLSEHEIEVIDGYVRVLTRTELRKMTALGTAPQPAHVLLLEPLRLTLGFYFSGILPVVRLYIYDIERDAALRQLQHIAHDTQCTSAALGDKREWLVGNARTPTDTQVDGNAPLWRVNFTDLPEESVLPGTAEQVVSFVLPESNWLEQALADESEREESSHLCDTQRAQASSARRSARMQIELDDDEPPALLTPDTQILLLQDDGGSGKDLEHTGEGTILASEAREKMLILISRRNRGERLLDRLMEQLEETTSNHVKANYLTAVTFARLWKEGIAMLAARTEGNCHRAFTLLSDHGVGVTTTGTVLHWMQGQVLGPRDEASIRAVGLAVNRKDISRRCHAIHLAIREVRLARMALGRTLVEYARNGKALGPDAVIDERLGLRRADLDELTRIGRIRRITFLPAQ